MFSDIDIAACQSLAVPAQIMQHVVRVESSFNPYAIGVVGGRLARQPRNLLEALATTRMLESKGYNFSLGLAQVNRHNLAKYGLQDYRKAFDACPNVQAGAKILAECHGRSGGDWGKSFSCYYSGNFSTGFRHGYVGKVMASLRDGAQPIPLVEDGPRRTSRAERRIVKDEGNPTPSAAYPPVSLPTPPPSSAPAAAQATAIAPAQPASRPEIDRAFVF